MSISFAHFLVLVSVVITLFGASFYIKDTLREKTKPNRVTWLMWAVAPLVGTFAALSLNADIWVTIRIFLAGFLPLIVFTASFFNPNSYWKLTKFDFICGFYRCLPLCCGYLLIFLDLLYY